LVGSSILSPGTNKIRTYSIFESADLPRKRRWEPCGKIATGEEKSGGQPSDLGLQIDGTFVVIEIPKDPINARFRTGGHGAAVQCKNCGCAVPIGVNLSKLPGMFEAKCRTCGETRIYRSGEIQTLTAVLKR
jgi:hypothetical protein